MDWPNKPFIFMWWWKNMLPTFMPRFEPGTRSWYWSTLQFDQVQRDPGPVGTEYLIYFTWETTQSPETQYHTRNEQSRPWCTVQLYTCTWSPFCSMAMCIFTAFGLSRWQSLLRSDNREKFYHSLHLLHISLNSLAWYLRLRASGV